MKGLVVVGILAVMAVAAVGCVSPTGAPIMGWIYTDVTGPGYAIDSSASFSKVGTSEASAIICVATGNASVQKAAQSVGIKKIHHVDVQYMSILGLYGKVTTTVYGE
ncbi:MAG: TRL-like family protein [Candidatus Auribacterota bacterium]|nr:TRL-like family protein [Candidatus Auribacterota bacterium]